jgi:nicotinamide-nucleotide amidase
MPSEAKLDQLAAQMLELLRSNNLKIAVAESVTGGLVSHIITNIDGASKNFLGSVVCYTADSKNILLGVDWDTINEYGTISPEVTEALLDGLRIEGADIGLAITGVAGSTLEGKKRGVVYVGIETQICKQVHNFKFSGTRIEIKRQAVEQAFQILIGELQKLG